MYKCLILISLESISKPLRVFLHKNLILVKYCYIGNFQWLWEGCIGVCPLFSV
nr:MAG TPA: hypothetical protein [Caudoviricetes sp.]